jgi:CRISPR/Cas system-associated protein Cas10 (large subunit of type III CRISPR-Cas system)
MDQNKINNLPIFDGIEFIYKVSISSELLMGNINNDDLLLANSINEVKQNLGYNNVYYYRDENLNLFLQFKDDTENSLDDLKRALTNKNIKPNGFSLYARLKY